MARARRTIRSDDDRWAEITAAARRRGISASDFLNEAAVAYITAEAERAAAAKSVAVLSAEITRELAELRERVAQLEAVTGARRR